MSADRLEKEKRVAKFEEELIHERLLTRDDINLLKPVFHFYDSDRDGLLSPDQTALALARLGFGDGSGAEQSLDISQFLQAVGKIKKSYADISHEGSREGKFRHLYHLINSQGLQTVSSDMLASFLRSINCSISEVHCDRLSELISGRDKKEFTENDFARFMLENSSS